MTRGCLHSDNPAPTLMRCRSKAIGCGPLCSDEQREELKQFAVEVGQDHQQQDCHSKNRARRGPLATAIAGGFLTHSKSLLSECERQKGVTSPFAA